MDANLKDKIKSLENKPGIYKMLDKKGNLLYIGKSKQLRNRVQSYFGNNLNSNRIIRMVRFIDDIEVVICENHLECKLLELKEIQKEKPIYNVQFNRKRKLAYLQINEKEIKIDYSEGFGPFASERVLNNFIQEIIYLFPLEIRDGRIIYSYQILPAKQTPLEKKTSNLALNELFSDRDLMADFRASLEQQMLINSKKLYFEKAKYFRDLRTLMEQISYRLFDFKDLFEAKIIYEEAGIYYLIYNGQILHKSPSLKEIKSIILPDINIKITDANYDLINLIYSHIEKEQDGRVIELEKKPFLTIV